MGRWLQVILVLAPAKWRRRREKCGRRLALGAQLELGNDHLGVSIVMGVPKILDGFC